MPLLKRFAPEVPGHNAGKVVIMSMSAMPPQETPPSDPALGRPSLEVESLSFEDALSELERIVRNLEEGRARLDEAIESYERGMLLKRHCETKLRDAQMKVERITATADSGLATEPVRIDP